MAIIENKKNAAVIRLVFLFTPIFFSLIIIFGLVGGIFHGAVFYIIVSVIFITVIYIQWKLKLYYFYYDEDGGKLRFRYHSLGPVGKQYKSIEIPKKSFIKFNIRKSMYGYKKDLILYQKIQGKTAKYPPVSISALNDEDYNILKKHLTKHAAK